MKQQKELILYLAGELGIVGERLAMMMEKIMRYDDIFQEFCGWLGSREYGIGASLVVEGYTAKQIHELNPRFEGIGTYLFLVTLREKPDVAKGYIKDGFRGCGAIA